MGETFCRTGTTLGSWTSGRPAELLKELRNETGRWFERALAARGRSTSVDEAAGGVFGCPYIDMADVARGGRLSRGLEVDSVLVGKGREPPGRVGRFVRRSFR